MKISNANVNAAATSAQQAGRTSGAEGSRSHGAERSGQAKSDQVQVSDLGNSLKALASHSADRGAKVAQLASSYQQGNYKVNAQAVGKSVVADALAK